MQCVNCFNTSCNIKPEYWSWKKEVESWNSMKKRKWILQLLGLSSRKYGSWLFFALKMIECFLISECLRKQCLDRRAMFDKTFTERHLYLGVGKRIWMRKDIILKIMIRYRTNLESIISILIVVTFQRRTIRYTDVTTNPTKCLRLDRDQTLMRLELMRRDRTAESPCCSLLARPCGRQGKKRDVMYIVWTTYTWFHRCNLKTEGVQGNPQHFLVLRL